VAEPFDGGRVSWAEAAGVARHRLRTQRYQRLAHDLYVPAGSAVTTTQRCAAFARVLPAEAVFCLGTAARLLGLPLPGGFDAELHAAVPAGAVVPERPELVTHGLLLPAGHVVVVDGVRATSAARTYVDLAAHLGDPALVALGDAALHRALTTEPELDTLLAGAAGRRGVVRARRARARLDRRAESAPESLVRVWLADARFPPAIPQVVVRNEFGAFVARVDLLIEEYGVVVEYEGEHHRDRERYGRDLARRNRLQALGLLVVHLDATTLSRPRVETVVGEALRSRGWSRRLLAG
jgi:very-short-patch-repair endonuclease